MWNNAVTRSRTQPLVHLLLLAAVLVGGALAVLPDRLSAGGYIARNTEAVRADALLRDRFGAGLPHVVLRVRSRAPAADPHVARAGRALVTRLARQPGVAHVYSYWTEGDRRLLSRDGHGVLVAVDLKGDEATTVRTAQSLVPRFNGRQGPFEVTATGASWVSAQASQISRRDVTRAELLGAPLVVIVLLLTFGSLPAALVPALVGVICVSSTLAVLRLIALWWPVSVFATNLTTALGFGLAVDYALFVVARYREELACGVPPGIAVSRTMRVMRPVVLCSAATVASCLSALLLIPLDYLRSLAVAGICVAVSAAAATVLLVPAALRVIGPRIDSLDPFSRWRRGAAPPGSDAGGWAALARLAARRPVLAGGCAALVLACLMLPFTHVRFGPIDQRVLPVTAESHATATRIDEEFDLPWTRAVQVTLPRTDPFDRLPALDAYARRLSSLKGVASVEGAAGTYRHGAQVAGPSPASALFVADGATWLSVVGDTAQNTDQLVTVLRTVPAPGPRLVSGEAARQSDTQREVERAVLPVLCLIALSVLVVLFLLTGSLIIPLKALAVGAMSLTASLGVLVYVFQDGHLTWMLGGTTVTGHIMIALPVSVCCLAFALGVDYELYLLSHIQEAHTPGADLTRTLPAAVARSSRVVTAAALLVATALLPLVTSQVTVIKALGVTLTVAILVDATVVRGILVPAAMRLLGDANWWAPAPFKRWHRRLVPAVSVRPPSPRHEPAAGHGLHERV
ncbi:MMPL family transporter [Streptomyces sp. NPDC052676]|uniref:MMPL family transporter n=1 Tax=Streptomyces sp. NPDC052676 TaxID=3154953 RepID=UPI00343625C8